MNTNDNGVYYFLGNITSHIIHILPLYRQLGGTVVVSSKKAKKSLLKEYSDLNIINVDNRPYRILKPGWRPKFIHEHTIIDGHLKKTCVYLSKHARVVLFYDLFDIKDVSLLNGPKKIFLHHGNSVKPFFTMQQKRQKILLQYDYIATLGPNVKKQLLSTSLDKTKLIDLGIARTDEVIKYQSKVVLSDPLINELSISPDTKIISYLPTFWGASSIYTTGLEIVKNIPDEYTLLFRPHPQTPAKLLRAYFHIINQKSNVIYAPEGRFKHLGLIDIFNASSVIIGDVSSVMLEAILTKKPLLFAYDVGDKRQPENSYLSIRDVVEKSGKIDMDNVTELSGLIHRSLQNGINEHVWTRTIDQNFYHADGTSVAAIKKFIESQL